MVQCRSYIHLSNEERLSKQTKLDVTKENDVKHIVSKIVKAHERIDILINNASLTGAKYTGNRFKIINMDNCLEKKIDIQNLLESKLLLYL